MDVGVPCPRLGKRQRLTHARNVVGWSSSLIDVRSGPVDYMVAKAYLMQEIARFHLGNHGCLDLGNISRQMLGGPTRAEGGAECKFSLCEHTVPISLTQKDSHMASNADLVCRQTRTPLVLHTANAIPNDSVSANSNTCR